MKVMDYLYECYDDSLRRRPYCYGSWILGHITGLVTLIYTLRVFIADAMVTFNLGWLDTTFGIMGSIIGAVLCTVFCEFIVHIIYGVIMDNIEDFIIWRRNVKWHKEHGD